MLWLPTTKKEVEQRGWQQLDVILFSGDAYVDHPAFGAAVIGRLLESQGLRVAIVPQPDWHGDFRDFRKLGRPRYFFGISPGAMDSMVNKYTAARRLRSEDAYSPDGRHDQRPEYPTIVYSRILKQLWPDAPVVLGGIEASMRRLTHYDYWQQALRPSILIDSQADLITYGMGEQPTLALCRLIEQKLLHGREEAQASAADLRQLLDKYPIRQTVMLKDSSSLKESDNDIILHSHEVCLKDRRLYAENFRHIEEESNSLQPRRIVQQIESKHITVVVEPPFPPMTTQEIDRSFDLPYTRLPHPKYRGKRIPAYDMIRHSVTIHRGCFGGCAFCTISAHQGKFIMSRSKESILREVEQITRMPDFRGNLSDLGGPSANMYMMGGKDRKLCLRCRRPSCIHPAICPNLNTDHRPLLDLYHAVDSVPGVKHSYIGSGIRYDLLLDNPTARQYTEEVITRHVSGRLKVAPEHTEDHVLKLMRKPSFELYQRFQSLFYDVCRRHGLRQQIIPYFISSHPGCTEQDMAALARKTRALGLHLEQVQDFTPTPMTVSTATWYSGFHPYTLKPVFSAHTPADKQRQRSYFFTDSRQPTTAPRPPKGKTDTKGLRSDKHKHKR